MSKEKQEAESEIINETDNPTALTIEKEQKELISQTKKRLSPSNLIEEFESASEDNHRDGFEILVKQSQPSISRSSCYLLNDLKVSF